VSKEREGSLTINNQLKAPGCSPHKRGKGGGEPGDCRGADLKCGGFTR